MASRPSTNSRSRVRTDTRHSAAASWMVRRAVTSSGRWNCADRYCSGPQPLLNPFREFLCLATIERHVDRLFPVPMVRFGAYLKTILGTVNCQPC